ncbi:MAG: hypothetical protein A2Y38_03415 [Spirochaetes bacterium GWB1_59_5]|nr:MAG: hypothetical protein A2Y38_03415 [Spirochaetes bacterium GWB1_59_5]
MATDISTNLHITGSDSLSGVLDKVNGNLEKTGKKAKEAATGTDAIGERAGDMERGFMGLKDVIGGIAEGPLAAVADRMGGIEAIVKGFGPGMGAVGLAIGAAAMGASLLYEQLEKARKAGIQHQIDELGKAQASKELLAERYGLTREMLGLQEKTVGVKGVQIDIDRQVVAIANLEAEILKKKLDGETEGIARREKEINIGRQVVSNLMLQLEKEKAIAASDEKRKATAMFIADNAGSMLAKERALELITDRKAQINARTALLTEKRALLEDKIAIAQRAQDSILTRSVKGMTELLGLREQLHTIAKEEQATMVSAESLLAEKQAKAAAAGQKWREKRKAQDEAARKAQDDYYAAEVQLGEKLAADAEARAASIIETQDKIRQQAIAAAVSPEGKAAAAADDLKIRAARERATLFATLAGDEERYKLRSLELDQRIAAEQLRINADLAKASKDARKKSEAESNQKISDALAVGAAVADVAKQGITGKRATAAIDATIAGAQALYQGAIGNIPGAIAAGLAAARWASVAIGGGGSEGAAAPAVGSGMTGATSSNSGSAPSGGGGAVIINFTKGFYGDAHSTAKSIGDTMKSIKGTGYAAWKGA